MIRVKVHLPLEDWFPPDGSLTLAWSYHPCWVSSVSTENSSSWYGGLTPTWALLAKGPLPSAPRVLPGLSGDAVHTPQLLLYVPLKSLTTGSPKGGAAQRETLLRHPDSRPGPSPLPGGLKSSQGQCSRDNPPVVFKCQNCCWYSRALAH